MVAVKQFYCLLVRGKLAGGYFAFYLFFKSIVAVAVAVAVTAFIHIAFSRFLLDTQQ